MISVVNVARTRLIELSDVNTCPGQAGDDQKMIRKDGQIESFEKLVKRLKLSLFKCGVT